MDTPLVTIKGIYQEGQIVPLSRFMPIGGFRVLITFLEPISNQEAEETIKIATSPLTQEESQESRAAQLGISKKEYEVLRLVQKGCTSREISEKLELGEGTVRNYISFLLNKIGGENRTGLVNAAIEKGLLAPP